MSRIGKQPIPVKAGVTVTVKDASVEIKGPRGTLVVPFNPLLKVSLQGADLIVERTDDSQQQKSLHGLTRTLLSNAVTGVADGFIKKLEVQGVGFKANMKGKDIELALGFSHPVLFKCPEGIKFAIDAENKNAVVIVIEGHDKAQVGEITARIRKLKKPEPYKGKGIRYVGEKVRRKAGKSAAK